MTGERQTWRDRWPIAKASRPWHHIVGTLVGVLIGPFVSLLVPPLVIVFLAGLALRAILIELRSAWRRVTKWLQEHQRPSAGQTQETGASQGAETNEKAGEP